MLCWGFFTGMKQLFVGSKSWSLLWFIISISGVKNRFTASFYSGIRRFSYFSERRGPNSEDKKSWTDCKSFWDHWYDHEYYMVGSEAFEWLRRIQTWLRPDDNGIQALVKSQWPLIQWQKQTKRERVTRPQLPEWPLSQAVDLQWQLTLFEASFRSSPNEGIQRWKRVERKKGGKENLGRKECAEKNWQHVKN